MMIVSFARKEAALRENVNPGDAVPPAPGRSSKRHTAITRL